MDVDAEGARWAQDANVTWCDSAEALVSAVGQGAVDVEVGAAEGGPILAALSQVAQRLQSLSLTGCDLDATAVVQLGAILGATQLRGVGVSNNPGVELAAWAELWQRLPLTVAKYDFGDCELSDEALPKLMSTLVRGQVHELFLDGNCLTDIAPILPCVSETAGLTELDIGDNELGDAQALALASALPGSVLTTLVLGRNPVSDAGAVPLVQALPRTRIRILHLDSTLIGDATLDALVAVLPSTQLEELHIDQTRITDAGALRLCQALPASRIAVLDAEDNNLSEATMAAIQAVLPSDTVVQ